MLSDSQHLYYTQKNCVQRIDLDTLDPGRHVYEDQMEFATTAFKADITPATIDECDGVVAVGGHCLSSPMRPGGRSMGYFAMHFEETGILERNDVGQMINNSVTCDKMEGTSSQYRSYICNNDRKMYSADVRNSQIVLNQPYSFQSSLNHCKPSPDGKTVIAVGDCSDIYMVHPDQPFKSAEKIMTNSDSGFSTAFMKCGVQFATCFQSGETYIYDLRNTTLPMHTIHSTRNITQGSFRNVRVAEPLEDLLFITEHEGRIHIVDTRDFEKHFVMMLPTTMLEDDIYSQPIIKPYSVIKDEIPKFGGEIEKSIHAYRSSQYPLGFRLNMNINRNSITAMLGDPTNRLTGGDRMRYSRFGFDDDGEADDMTSSSTSSSTSGEGGSTEIVIPELHPPGIVVNPQYNRNRRATISDDNDGMDGIILSGTTCDNDGEDTSDLDEDFSWTRRETGNTYSKTEIKSSKLFQYKKDDCPVLYDQRGEIKYVLDLKKRVYDFHSGWEKVNPMNDPFNFVDSTLDILGMEILDYKGDKTLSFATYQGINLWSINQWKRQCYPVYELC